MTDTTALANIGELSKPATVLVEKVSDAIGGIFKPWQIRRVAQAEAEAEKIRAVSQIEISKLHHRALQRFVAEEAKRQNNIEAITAKALPQVDENAQPQNMEDDWITNFFDKCRLISDDEMQSLWSKVLAGEANSPGKYSKRTVNFLGSLDKSDAILLQALYKFIWFIEGEATLLIYNSEAEIYNKHGIDFSSLQHLDEIGFLTFESLRGFVADKLQKNISTVYYDKSINIEFENKNDLPIGVAVLSKIGKELEPICSSKPIPEFFDYIIEDWAIKKGVRVFSPILIGKQ
ncbi:MAG: DUF2806 domain-containing protein [Chloroflexi bacterium]|nr:DUF2806 domain-containing protein [Chloroflexota bacterium]